MTRPAGYPKNLEHRARLRDGTRVWIRPILPEDEARLVAFYERGVGRYEPAGEADEAEVAFVVQDDWQNRGLGTILLRDLLAAGVAGGLRRFRAFVLADNARMLDLLNRFTDVRRRTTESGVVELSFVARPLPAEAEPLC